MQADLSVWENNTDQGGTIEQNQTIAKIDFRKISLLHENQAPAEAVLGK